MMLNLKLDKGTWLVANCGKYPSEKNCKVVFMSPEKQKDDLVDAIVAHAVKVHGHNDTPEFRKEIGGMLEKMDV